jgi:O-antigen/teichoic acid export membrane protein
MTELPPEEPTRADRNRLRGFLNHLIIYFSAMIVLAPVYFFLTPDRLWFVFPLVAWGAPLAIHAAFAMGLFESWRRPSSGKHGGNP